MSFDQDSFFTQDSRVLDDQNGEMSPEMIYTLLQSGATELERSTEVRDQLLL